MADQAISGEFELSDADARAFDFPAGRIRRLDVADKVGFPDMLHAGLVALVAFTLK